MRIIAGEFRSRRLLTPRDDSVTRPIPDRVKESLFGLLRGHCEGANVFDGFAGTGALGLEAVSRGAARCVFVERDKGTAELLRKNVEALGVGDRCEVVVGDALGPGALSRSPRPLRLAFLDPPYPLVKDQVGWKRVRAQLANLVELLEEDGFAVVRTPWPFLIEIPAAGAAVAAEPARRKRRGPRRGGEVRRRGDWGAAEREGEEEMEVAGAEPARPAVQKVEGDLSLPNAEGPETHVYHTTAVHLYMRKLGRSEPGNAV